jgi:hypothetical protein
VHRKSIRDGTPAVIWLEIEKEERQRISARPSLRSSLFSLSALALVMLATVFVGFPHRRKNPHSLVAKARTFCLKQLWPSEKLEDMLPFLRSSTACSRGLVLISVCVFASSASDFVPRKNQHLRNCKTGTQSPTRLRCCARHSCRWSHTSASSSLAS